MSGGEVSLAGLTTDTGGSTHILAQGSGSVVDLSALTKLISNQGGNSSALQVADGGTVLDPGLASLDDVNVTLDGTGTLDTNQWSTLTNVGITITGGAYSFSGITTLPDTLNLTGGSVALPGLTNANNATINVSGGSTLTLPAPTAFTASGAVVTVSGDWSSLAIGDGILNPIPTSGTGVTINVPQFPQGMTLNLNPNGTFSGGTTFDVGAGAVVDVESGTYTGGVTFNLSQGAVVNLTGGQTVTYTGTLTGSGTGTVQLSSGTLAIGIGGVTFNFPGSMFQWTGGGISGAAGNLTNLGTINLAGSNDKIFYNDGTLDDYGTIVQTGNGNFALHSDNQAPTILNVEPGGSY